MVIAVSINNLVRRGYVNRNGSIKYNMHRLNSFTDKIYSKIGLALETVWIYFMEILSFRTI